MSENAKRDLEIIDAKSSQANTIQKEAETLRRLVDDLRLAGNDRKSEQ
jgi:hypothetical protein